jgi:hypothetical protein
VPWKIPSRAGKRNQECELLGGVVLGLEQADWGQLAFEGSLARGEQIGHAMLEKHVVSRESSVAA